MKKQGIMKLAMAAALGTGALANVPQAQAVEKLKITAIDTYKANKESDYKFTFELEKDLNAGEDLLIVFDKAFAIDANISRSNVRINGSEARSVKLDNGKLTIVPAKDYEAGDELEVVIRDVITNPDKEGSYEIKVKTEREGYGRKQVKIAEVKADEDFTVKLSDPKAGARTSYSFAADFGKKELIPNGQVILTFPSAEQIPAILSASDFTVNGKTVQKVSAAGKKVYLTAPGNLAKSSRVEVKISQTAWITNPKTPGSYKLEMTVDGRTITSKPFEIVSAQPAAVSAAASNSAATITLGNTNTDQPTDVAVSIKALGVPLAKQRDFIEIVFPKEFRIPPYIAPGNVTVNGASADFVAVRGQNVLVYPAQDLGTAEAINVNIGNGANIVTPTEKNTYSISVYTSAERGVLFARAVGIGVPQPVPVSVTTGQAVPVTPAASPASTPPASAAAQPQAMEVPATGQPEGVPANAALFRLNDASFSKNGQKMPLKAAPYLANGTTTMVPAQFFKDALGLTTQWNTREVSIISGTKVLQFTVGSDKARIGGQEYTLTAAVAIKDEMPMIPIRFVTDALGYKVGWDAKTSSVYVYRE